MVTLIVMVTLMVMLTWRCGDTDGDGDNGGVDDMGVVVTWVVVTPKQEEILTVGISPTFLCLERGRGLF